MKDHTEKKINKWGNFKPCTVIDVTLRDGGFRVDFNWTKYEICTIVDYISKSNISHIELGYLGGIPDSHNSFSGFSTNFPLELVRELASNYPHLQLVLMIHPSALNNSVDYQKIKQAGISFLRFVFHPIWSSKLSEEIKKAQAVGIKTSINIALISRYEIGEIKDLCDAFNILKPDIVYIADTCSNLHPEEVGKIFKLLSKNLIVDTGFHSHNSLSFALINTLTAISYGAKYIDISINGIGRGAGNLNSMLWCLNEISQNKNNYKLKYIYDCETFINKKLNKTNDEDLLYLVSGAFNLTPVEEDILIELSKKKGTSLNEIIFQFVEKYHSILDIKIETLDKTLLVQ